jgi:O-succinylbenzoate synthase
MHDDSLVFDLPMRLRFRGQDRRSGVLLHGPAGWGEFSPFPDYEDPLCVPWLTAAKEAAVDGWPAALRHEIPVNVTVPAVDAGRAHAHVTGSGCSTAKVKVAEPGQTLADDIERVEAVRDALGPTGRVRVDANGAWSVDQAIDALKQLNAFDLEYAEQPVRTLEEMAELRRAIDVPLAADESVRTAQDPLRVAGLDAADIVVLKVQPLGGVRRCLQVAEACGLPVVVSSAVETSIGLAAGVALAAALPDLPYACGLGTMQLLAADVTAESLIPVGGMLPVRRPEPDPALFATDDAIRDRWLERLGRVEAMS